MGFYEELIGVIASSYQASSTWTMVLSTSGTGAATSRLVMYATEATSATVDGSYAHFYSDAAGTLNESQTWNLSAGWNTRYVKVTSGGSNLVFADTSKIAKWGDSGATAYIGWTTQTNSPTLSASVGDFPLLSAWRSTGTMTLSGDFSRFNTSMTYFEVSGSVSSTMTGTKSGPASTTYFSPGFSSYITLDVTNLTSATFLGSNTNWTLQGSVSALSACTTLTGTSSTNFNASGDLAGMSALVNLYAPVGSSSISYPTTSGTHAWPSSMQRIYLRSQTLSTASIDALLIDLAAQSSWTGLKIISIKGTRSSASDAAYATLTGYGVAVTVST